MCKPAQYGRSSTDRRVQGGWSREREREAGSAKWLRKKDFKSFIQKKKACRGTYCRSSQTRLAARFHAASTPGFVAISAKTLRELELLNESLLWRVNGMRKEKSTSYLVVQDEEEELCVDAR